ncbi:MAG TPA: cell surface protein, partial [Methanosarcina sp.]|nr:cell surface protein [Methanosarcina sp.]
MMKVKTLYKISLISIALVLLLVSSIASAATAESVSPMITETKITTSGSARYPAIYGDKIVWEDRRNEYENPNIYMYDLSTKKETKITTNESLPEFPAIYGDKIVWSDRRNSGSNPPTEIYMYDLSTSKESRISPSDYYSYWYLGFPKINDDKIVWQDWDGVDASNIHMYDLSTSTQVQITFSGDAYGPDIYGDRVIYIDKRNRVYDIYMYDLSTQEEKKIITSRLGSCPVIYEDRIVWQDQRNDNIENWNPDIYYYGSAEGHEYPDLQVGDEVNPRT